jgi:beta-galactosidase
MNLPVEQQWNRRKFLRTALAGAGGLAAISILGSCAGGRYVHEGKRGPAARTIPFNTDWLFGGEMRQGALDQDYEDGAFQRVTLPHIVSDLSWRKWNPESWEKIWVYRRHFKLDTEDIRGMRIFLEMGAGMTSATLLLNGHKLGEHVGGYLPLSYELTGHLQPGNNVLAVEVDSRFNINVPPDKPGKDPRSVDFWQPGGLYRPASLHLVPPVFLSDVFAKPVNVLDAGRRLEVACTIDAATMPTGALSIEVVLRDGKKTVARQETPVQLTAKGQMTVTLSLDNIGDVHLWDLEDPYLYEVIATLSVGGKPVHDYAVRTGFRQARFTGKGFYLNGRRVQLFGVNRHQFFPFVGGAMPDRVQRRDAEILRRELNCNMVRCSHYPQSEAFFDACDEVGLMAWEEAPGWGSPLGNAEWKARAVHAVGQMVGRDRNHPSIIIWGARLNETPDDVALYTKTRNLAHRLDDSRQTTGAMVGGKHDTKQFVQDVFSYNDYAHGKTADGSRQPELLPPRTDFPYFVSEAVGTLSGPAKYYRRIDPASAQQGQAMAHARVHNIAGADERYCGVAVWSGYDYPSGSGNQYDGVKYTGVIDLFRELKPGAAIYQAQVDPKIRAVIAPAFYWDFSPQSLPLKEGEKAMICSNCERLELFVDGKHHGTLLPDTRAYAHLRYAPCFADFDQVEGTTKPELRIDGYVGDHKLISRSFSADRQQDRLSVIADDEEILADGSDATRVVFRAVDKYGAPRPYVTGEVNLTLEGPAILVGETPFDFEACGGVGAVWIKSRPGRSGKISLQAHHGVLGSGKVMITARRS